MKKLISLILCMVFVCLALVSCKQEKIGDYLEKYKNNENKDDALEVLNFYIITGDGTTTDAMTTVPQHINAYVKDKYKVELKIHYFTEAEYQAKVTAAMDTTVEANRPDIVLINGADMFDGLKSSLVPLNTSDFNFYGEDYKKLNTIVKQALLNACAENGVYYTVPNNHNVGTYQYVVFDQKMAQMLGYRNQYDFGNPKKLVANVNTAEAVDSFVNALNAEYPDLDANDYIQVVTGDYALLESLKHKNLAGGDPSKAVVNHVNVMAYPNATREEAHLSAFAIVKQLNDDGVYETDEERETLKNHYNKCMKIIYALNTDATLKNLLQYGFVGTNYSHQTNEKNEAINVVNLVDVNDLNRYEMNHIHTGDSFNSGFYYCDDIGWSKETEANWLKQIAEAKTSEEKISYEFNNLLTALKNVEGGSTVLVSTNGSHYSDVAIAWTSTNENVVIDSAKGTLTFKDVSAEIDINVVITCNNVTVTEVIKVTLNKTEA